MLKPEDHADAQVVISHPWGNVEVPLTPGPLNFESWAGSEYGTTWESWKRF